MPDILTSLWPEDIRVDVLSPLTILRVQAESLGKATRGILKGAIETESSEKQLQHRLVVVAPAYHGYRHTLITALHGLDLPYPVEVRAESLERSEKRDVLVPSMTDVIIGRKHYYETYFPVANDDAQMLKLVQEALRSGPTRALITSLIAKSNEVNARPSPDSNENGHAGHESTPDASDDGPDSAE